MTMDILKDNSISELIRQRSGNYGVNFYPSLFEEGINEYLELTGKLKQMTKEKFDFNSVIIKDNVMTLVTNSQTRELKIEDKRDLGLRGDTKQKQLQYFRLLNEVLRDNNIDQQFFIYYDELEPDTHWIGFMDKVSVNELLNFIKDSNPDELNGFSKDSVRVLGIGIADGELNEYHELVIFPQ